MDLKVELVTLQNAKFKEKKGGGGGEGGGGGKERKWETISPARDRTWIASVTDQHDNHYTTPIADSISEIPNYGRV